MTHHIIISAPYLRSTNLLSSLYYVCLHLFEARQDLKDEHEKTQQKMKAPSLTQEVKSSNSLTAPKKKKSKKKSHNTLSELTEIEQSKEQEDTLDGDLEKIGPNTLASSSENQEINQAVESNSQVENSLELTSPHETIPLSANTLIEEKMDEAYSAPLEHHTEAMTDHEEGEWTIVGAAKKMPPLKITNPKDTAQKKNHKKKIRERKPSSIVLPTTTKNSPQKAQVDEKRMVNITYAEVTASQQNLLNKEQQPLNSSSKDLDISSHATDTITQVCNLTQQDTDLNSLTADSSTIIDSISEESQEHKEIKSTMLVERSTETEEDTPLSSTKPQLDNLLENSVSSSKNSIYRPKKASRRYPINPPNTTVFVPYPVYVPVPTGYYPQTTVQYGYNSNGYCNGLVCINGLEHFWMEKTAECSAYFQCQTCSLIIQK